MPALQRLRRDHAPAILAFETANRAYFAASISDRGDEFFEHFEERHDALLAEQEAGVGAYYVLVDDDGSILGRFNLVFVGEGVAELGYRVAQHATGRGVATAAVTTSAGSRPRSTRSPRCEPPSPTGTWHRGGCCSRRVSRPLGPPIRRTSGGSREPGTGVT